MKQLIAKKTVIDLLLNGRHDILNSYYRETGIAEYAEANAGEDGKRSLG